MEWLTGILQFGAVLGGFLLTIALAYCLWKAHPVGGAGVGLGVIAATMMALGTGSQLAISLSPEKGLSAQVAELEKKINDQQAQLAAYATFGKSVSGLVSASEVTPDGLKFKDAIKASNSAEQVKTFDWNAVYAPGGNKLYEAPRSTPTPPQ